MMPHLFFDLVAFVLVPSLPPFPPFLPPCSGSTTTSGFAFLDGCFVLSAEAVRLRLFWGDGGAWALPPEPERVVRAILKVRWVLMGVDVLEMSVDVENVVVLRLAVFCLYEFRGLRYVSI
jgi:hypothetical protein